MWKYEQRSEESDIEQAGTVAAVCVLAVPPLYSVIAIALSTSPAGEASTGG
jgi:hypothetical protein